MSKLDFVLSLMMKENDYQNGQALAAQEAALRLGVNLKVLYAGGDAIGQSQQLLDIIQSSTAASRPDAILCQPVGTALLQVATEATSRGIGWALLNRDADYIRDLRRTSSAPVFSVVLDQDEIGRIQGRQLQALLPSGGLALLVLGPTGNPVVQQRLASLQSTKPANVQVRTLTADWTETGGYKAVCRWLELSTSRATPVSLVAAQNDNMAMGARKAFEEKLVGRDRERWARLPYMGCDGCPSAGQEWIRRGLLRASIIMPPTAGLAVEMLVQAIQTKWELPERKQLEPTSYPAIKKLAEAYAPLSVASGR